MRRYGKARDKCERAIVTLLEGYGATVTRLDGEAGLPDLLVGFRGVTLLMECKDPDDGARNSRGAGGRKVANPAGIRDSQWTWHERWKGARPIVVTTPEEALAALERVDWRAVRPIGEPRY